MPVNERVHLLNMLIFINMLFFNPIHITSGLAHIARSYDMTVFEISMLGGWRKIAIAKIFSMLVYMAPYMLFQVMVSSLFSRLCSLDYKLTLYTVLSIYFYTGLALMLSLIKSKTTTLLSSTLILFIAPLSVIILITNYLMFGARLDNLTSLISYILNPLSTYWYSIEDPGLISINWTNGLFVYIAVTLGLYTSFIFFFERAEIKI